MASVTCRVQFLEDSDPFVCTNFPEPRRPPTVDLEENLPLSEQIPAIHKLLDAPHKPPRLSLSLQKFCSRAPQECSTPNVDRGNSKGHFITECFIW